MAAEVAILQRMAQRNGAVARGQLLLQHGVNPLQFWLRMTGVLARFWLPVGRPGLPFWVVCGSVEIRWCAFVWAAAFSTSVRRMCSTRIGYDASLLQAHQ
jgi:hypothetical protein